MIKNYESQTFLPTVLESPFYCVVIRKHFFKDQPYLLKFQNFQMTMAQNQNNAQPKYMLNFEKNTTFEWIIKENRLEGFKFPYQGKFKNFYGQQTDLIKLRERLGKITLFLNLTQSYTYLSTLEAGCFGQVTINSSKFQNKKVAVKHLILNGKKDFQSQIENEIRILRLLKHPKILEIYEVFKNDLYYQIVTEYIEGNNLKQIIINKSGQFQTQEILEIMEQLFEALIVIHKNNILHRDIKPANIMYSNGKLKIIDFGLSCFDGRQMIENPNCGTEGYVAPEVWNSSQNKLQYDFKVDVYSAGCVLHKMLTGNNMQQKNNSIANLNKVKLNKTENAILFDLVQILTKQNPFDRPSSLQALELVKQIKEYNIIDLNYWYSNTFNLSNSNQTYQTASTARQCLTQKTQKSVCSYNSARNHTPNLSKQIIK